MPGKSGQGNADLLNLKFPGRFLLLYLKCSFSDNCFLCNKWKGTVYSCCITLWQDTIQSSMEIVKTLKSFLSSSEASNTGLELGSDIFLYSTSRKNVIWHTLTRKIWRSSLNFSVIKMFLSYVVTEHRLKSSSLSNKNAFFL